MIRTEILHAAWGYAKSSNGRGQALSQAGTPMISVLVALFLTELIGGGAFAQDAKVDGSDLINLIRKAAENVVYDGRVVAANQTDIASTLDSVVAQIHFSAERSVTAGDPPFTLDPTEFELGVRTAEARLLGAQADNDLANENYIRAETLYERGTVTEPQLQIAKSELADAQAALALAEVALDGAVLTRSVSRFPDHQVDADGHSALSDPVQADPCQQRPERSDGDSHVVGRIRQTSACSETGHACQGSDRGR